MTRHESGRRWAMAWRHFMLMPAHDAAQLRHGCALFRKGAIGRAFRRPISRRTPPQARAPIGHHTADVAAAISGLISFAFASIWASMPMPSQRACQKPRSSRPPASRLMGGRHYIDQHRRFTRRLRRWAIGVSPRADCADMIAIFDGAMVADSFDMMTCGAAIFISPLSDNDDYLRLAMRIAATLI